MIVTVEDPPFRRGRTRLTAWAGDHLLDGTALIVWNGDVHPDHRGLGIGTQLLQRLEQLAITLASARFPDSPVRLRTSGGTAGSSRADLLERRGYRADSYFITMEVVLSRWRDPGPSTTVVPLDETLNQRDVEPDLRREPERPPACAPSP